MDSHLVIEKIGSEEALRTLALPEDIRAVEGVSNTNRRCEILSWRAVVRRELGSEVHIFYDDYGAPNVAMPDTYISVSHSKGVVAVLFSDYPCAVDIEQRSRDFRNVAPKYLSTAEQRIAEEYDLYAEMWSAKEALYKYYRKGSLDLVKHISIVEYVADKHSLVATILGSEPISVYLQNEGNYVVASILR